MSPIRPHPEGKDALQQLRGEAWVDITAWLCSESDGVPSLRFLDVGQLPPDGAKRVEHPVALLEALSAQAKARQTLANAHLGEADEFVLRLICLLEDDDRRRWLVQRASPVLWELLQFVGPLGDVDALIDRLIRGGVVTACAHTSPVQHLGVPEHVETQVRLTLPPAFAKSIFDFMVKLWADKFVREQARPTCDTVRAGIGASVYMVRLGLWETAFDALEREVLPVARGTGEATPVLTHLANYAKWSALPQLAERLERCQRRG